MIYWNTPRFLIRLLSNYHWHFSRERKIIYLTFDDGPTPIITEQVLKILDNFGIKATFFSLGRNIERHPELYQKILNGGHIVGNHTYSHLNGWKTSAKSYLHDVNLAGSIAPGALFRPPYGRIKRTQAKYISRFYKIIMWDVLSHDYNRHLSSRLILRSIIRSTKNGSIVVFHDSAKAADRLLSVLPKYIEHFSQKGYSFEKIDIG